MSNLIAQPLEWNSDTRHAFARQVQANMLAFNEDMSRANGQRKIAHADLELWRRFRDGWSKWYGSAGLLTWSFDSTVVTISAYATQLQAWRDKYRQWTGKTASGAGTVAPDFDWTPVYWAAAGAVVVGAGYIYWTNNKGRIVRGAAVNYAKSRLGLGDIDFDFSHMEPRGRRRGFGDPDASQVLERGALVKETRKRFAAALRKSNKAIDNRSPFAASRFLREAEHIARSSAPGLGRELLKDIDQAKRELATFAAVASNAELRMRGEGLEELDDRHAARSQRLLQKAKHQLDRRDLRGSARALKEAAVSLSRVSDPKRAAALAQSLGEGQLFLKRERQFRPTREMHELGDIALVDDQLHFDEVEIGADDPDEPDEDDELDEESSLMRVPEPQVPEPWDFR